MSMGDSSSHESLPEPMLRGKGNHRPKGLKPLHSSKRTLSSAARCKFCGDALSDNVRVPCRGAAVKGLSTQEASQMQDTYG